MKGKETEKEGWIVPADPYKDLEREIKELREELSRLILEKEELLKVICPQILRDYYALFGELEYRVSEAECEYRRLRRLAEMVQARNNRGEEVSLSALLDDLVQEFDRYQKELERFLKQVQEAAEKAREQEEAERAAEETSPEEVERKKDREDLLKKTYRELVKRLHPDMNPDQSEAERRMFQQAVEAYEKGDLETLELIQSQLEAAGGMDSGLEAAAGEDPPAFAAGRGGTLRQKRDLLKAQTERLREEIARMKAGMPYLLKEYLEDPEKAALRRESLNKTLQGYEEGIREYRKILEEKGIQA